MPIEEVRELVDAAKQHGRQTFAHASGTDGVENSIEGGVNTVEHGFFITEEQLTKMRDRRIAWVPTFAPVQLQIDRAEDLGWSDEVVGHLKRIIDVAPANAPPRARAGRARSSPAATPAPAASRTALGLLQEMDQMEHAGLPPMAVLNSRDRHQRRDARRSPNRSAASPRAFARASSSRGTTRSQTVANLQKDKTILFDGQCDCWRG